MPELTEKLVFGMLSDYVNKRYQDVLNNPDKKIVDRWNLSNFFYIERKDLDALGYDTSPLNDENTGWRKRIYAQVRVICEKELGIKRHEAGIFPADRAVMAFQGELYSVSFDNIEHLKLNGPDVIFIEKEGIVEKLVPFTTDLGIALVHSKGFYSEYAEMLANEAIAWGGNVGVLTDFDSAGINIGLKLKGPVRLQKKEEKISFRIRTKTGITTLKLEQALYKKIPKRIGIDLETLEDLGLKVAELRESALNKNGQPTSHWLGLYNTLIGKKKRDNSKEWTYNQMNWYFPYLKKKVNGISYLLFLRDYRIELDTVVNIVGAQKFWEWLKKQILKTFETRDYNRAIVVPRYVATPTMENFQEKLEKAITEITKERVDKIVKELRTMKELVNTEEKLEEIKSDLRDNYILKDARIKKIDNTLEELIKTL